MHVTRDNPRAASCSASFWVHWSLRLDMHVPTLHSIRTMVHQARLNLASGKAHCYTVYLTITTLTCY